MKKIYTAIIVLLVIFSTLHLVFSKSLYEGLLSLPGGLATEICGILITLFFVERIINKNNTDKQKHIMTVLESRV